MKVRGMRRETKGASYKGMFPASVQITGNRKLLTENLVS